MQQGSFAYSPWIFLWFCISAILFSFVMNELLLRFSKTLGSRQQPQRHVIRWSSTIKPSVGGFSFYLVLMISVFLFLLFQWPESVFSQKQLLGFFACATAGFLLGLADDAYDTVPLLKFLVQVGCGLILVVTETVIHCTPWFAVNATVTVLWVVGIMNAINMLDNMDGIAGIVSLFIFLNFFWVSVVSGNLYSVPALIAAGMMGALIGFLIVNWYPSRIYMGDTGSQLLGATLAALSISVLWNFDRRQELVVDVKQWLLPAIVFAIPLIDISTVCLRRILRRQSPFVGGRDHISHHLVYFGFREQAVIYILGGWSALSTAVTAFFAANYAHLSVLWIVAGFTYVGVCFLCVQWIYQMTPQSHRPTSEARVQSAVYPLTNQGQLNE